MKKENGSINLPETLVLVAGIVAIVVFIFILNRPPFYDEDDYLGNVFLIHKFGFSKEYLMNHIGSAGPLYSAIHYLLEPITHLQSPNIRLVNIAFLAGITYFLNRSLVMLKYADGKYALTIMAIPMTYVISGLALTEMPAMFFLTAGIYMIFKALQKTSTFTSAAILSIAGGIFVSLAIIGRQPYILILAALPILFYNKKDLKRSLALLAVTLIFTLLLPVSIFFVWSGLVAPSDATFYANLASQGVVYRPELFLLCLAYYAIVFLLIAPRFYILPSNRGRIRLVFIFIVIAALNHTFDLIRFFPLKSFLVQLIPSYTQIAMIEKLAGSALAMAGVYFLMALLVQLQRSAFRKELLFYAMAILVIALSCIKLTHGFSSRYAAQAIPLLIPLAGFFHEKSSGNIARFTMGVILGIMSLVGFFLYER